MYGTSKGALLEQLGFRGTDEQISLSVVCMITRDLINNLLYITSIFTVEEKRRKCASEEQV
jgi:hypothetical protein